LGFVKESSHARFQQFGDIPLVKASFKNLS
jgi:hypothetical protein